MAIQAQDQELAKVLQEQVCMCVCVCIDKGGPVVGMSSVHLFQTIIIIASNLFLACPV